MANKASIEQRAEQLILPILEENSFELWDVEYVKEGGTWYLRAYIDKPGGITIDDCELVSRAFNEKLDEEDFIGDAYIMEISSPGLGRALKKDRDFERCIGEDVDVRLYKAMDGEKEFTGALKAFSKEQITVEFEDGQTLEVLRKDIAQVRLSFDF